LKLKVYCNSNYPRMGQAHGKIIFWLNSGPFTSFCHRVCPE
jgi:hypothetical protein